jgi:transcriptional regulator with XRE-family HTH domain
MTFACRRPNSVFSSEYRVLRETLSEARREAGMSQRQLAAHLDKSPSHVARIECGQRRVDTLEFHAIACALGLDPVTLFARVARRLDATSEAREKARGGPRAAAV